MCGIVGILSFTSLRNHILESLPLLEHRGPDGCGHIVDKFVALGHTRLSIIDLSERASQPMKTHDGRYTIVYNGEIYNYLELRKELYSNGAKFLTNSDTEVVLEAYRIWGETCVSRFRGMFAFAIWDTKEQALFIARDRCGERPLFFHHAKDSFYFASELKALIPLLPCVPPLNPLAVDMYLHYQYTPEPFTLLEGIHKLPAAHTLTLSKKHWDAKPERYWNVETCAKNWEGTIPTRTEDILSGIKNGLEQAVVMNLRADVPVAVALSGGIDSGAIAAFAQKHSPEPLHAFSVGYPGRPPYDEREQAKSLANHLGMIFHEVILPVDNFVDFFPTLIRIMDEPIADPAAFGHFAIPKAAHDMGIKVLLSGIGGDELFWGYNWARQAAVHNSERLRWSAILNLPGMGRIVKRFAKAHKLPKAVQTICNQILESQKYIPEASKSFLAFYETTPDFARMRTTVQSLYGKGMQAVPRLNAYTPENIGARTINEIPAAVVKLLFDTWLTSNCLTLGDRVSMGNSVETRLPFLDVKLIELVMALRTKTPDHCLGQKYWLRTALKGILPDNVLKRPKAGFRPPVEIWLKATLKRYGHECKSGMLYNAEIIKPEICKSLDALGNDNTSIFIAYKLLLLEKWYQTLTSQTR